MRVRLGTVAVIVTSLLALAPAPAGAAGFTVVAAGYADHELTEADGSLSCATTMPFTVVIDLVAAAGSIAGASDCVFQPDVYDPGTCVGEAEGTVTCAYAGANGASSRLDLYADGTLSYTYVFDDGTVETVRGTLTRA